MFSGCANYHFIPCFWQVKQWITFNEPWIITLLGYGDGVFPPGITGSGTNSYTASHHLILAHAQAYRMYQSEFADAQNGQYTFFESAFFTYHHWLLLYVCIYQSFQGWLESLVILDTRSRQTLTIPQASKQPIGPFSLTLDGLLIRFWWTESTLKL